MLLMIMLCDCKSCPPKLEIGHPPYQFVCAALGAANKPIYKSATQGEIATNDITIKQLSLIIENYLINNPS